MKSTFYLPLYLFVMIAVTASGFNTKNQEEPWTNKQLLAPVELANTINDSTAKQPIIFCIGPGAIIKNSIDIGPAKEEKNLAKLYDELSKLSKDTTIVIYCGCCPFEHCPNIRPAFLLLNKMKFSNPKLLNLPKNIKVDWIDKGFPINK